MLAKEVITSVRALIGDTNANKWTSPMVLDALNNARTELVRQTGLLKTTGTLVINPEDRIYLLPSDCFYLTRVVYKEENIPFISMEELDKSNPSWFTEAPSDTLEYIVYDNLNQNQIMTYPVLTASASPYIVEGSQGPITDVIDEESIITGPLYGAVTSIVDTNIHVVTREDNFGVLTDIIDPTLTIKIYYTQKPIPLYSENQDIVIDSIYKMYLVYKTVSELLSYDSQVENVNKSVLFDNKAQAQLKSIRGNSVMDYVVEKNINFTYRGAFDE